MGGMQSKMLERLRQWWIRPCSGRDVLTLALPLIISTMSSTIMVFMDRIFLVWYSTEAVAASLPAAMLHFSVTCFPLGLAAYVNTFVAQYEGAGRPRRIGPIVWQGIWIGVIATPLLLATIPLARLPFTLAGHDPAIVDLEVDCYRILNLGAGAIVLAAAQSSFFIGRSATRVVMLVDCSAALLNGLLDYTWIFGRFGFPAGGIAGAAWATTTAEWYRVAVYAAIMLRPAYRHTYDLAGGWRWNWPLMRRLLRFGGPGGLQWLMETVSFTLFILLVGRLGKVALASTNLAFNVNSLAWVPMMGMGLAVSTMVGQQIGRNRPNLAARATWTALGIAAVYMGAIGLCYVLVPQWFLMGYAAGVSTEAFSPVRDSTVVLLRFVAAYCLFDAMNLIFVSAIRGAGDMRFILITTLVMAVLPMSVAWWGVSHLGWGLIGCWTVITLWVCSLGLIYMARFLQGRWRHMQVIEMESAGAGVPSAEAE